jgi:hypothetical protein
MRGLLVISGSEPMAKVAVLRLGDKRGERDEGAIQGEHRDVDMVCQGLPGKVGPPVIATVARAVSAKTT